MDKKSRNLNKQEREKRNKDLLSDYDLLISAGVLKMDAQKKLSDKYNLPGYNSVGSIIYKRNKKQKDARTN